MTTPPFDRAQMEAFVRNAPARQAERIARYTADPTVQAMLRHRPGDPPIPGTTTTTIPLVRTP